LRTYSKKYRRQGDLVADLRLAVVDHRRLRHLDSNLTCDCTVNELTQKYYETRYSFKANKALPNMIAEADMRKLVSVVLLSRCHCNNEVTVPAPDWTV
jgi:hypothetical protein